jgi:hypothetical protein
MKKLILLFVLATSYQCFSQTIEQEMEKKAREFHRVIGLSDKQQWKKFIQENYAKSFIERPMKTKVSEQDGGSASATTTDIQGTIEDKVQMLERLHGDFGDSKIGSIKTTGETLEMVLDGADISGAFKFKFEKTKPYLISGIGVNAESGR